MGRVACFTLAGLDLWFNSDEHRPPHFHAERPGEWEVRVFFLREPDEMFETKWTKKPNRPSKKDLRPLAQLASRNRAPLLVEFEDKANVTAPGPER